MNNLGTIAARLMFAVHPKRCPYATPLLVLMVACLVALSGCSSFKSHNELMEPVLITHKTQGPQKAYDLLNASLGKSKKAELLYALELGELLRQGKYYEESTQLWETADAQIRAWERTATLAPQKLLSYLGASTINERIKPYEAQDYEKTWVSTRIALNHLAMNDWDKARVAIKRTHEREAIIAAFRGKELAAIREEASAQNMDIKNEVLGGYPVDDLGSSDVLALHNSYQNAFSHYLAGFIYEALNEPSLSAPGYRKAIELNPKAVLLQKGLRDMNTRMRYSRHADATLTDVLFIVETGEAPARIPFEVHLPFFYEDKDHKLQTLYVSVAFPMIKPTPAANPIVIGLGGKTLQATAVMDLNLMARRALRDEMPGLIMRGLTRVASKGALQYYANEQNEWVALFAAIFSIVTEQADDRIWRTLPGNVLLARDYIAPGDYALMIDGHNTGKIIHIQGRYAVVPIRISGRLTLVGDTGAYGNLSLAPSTTGAPDPALLGTFSTPTSTKLMPVAPEQKPNRHPIKE